MRREDGNDEDAAEPDERIFRGDAGFAHGPQSAAQFTALRLALRIVASDLDREPSPLAVVKRKRAAQPLGLLHRHRTNGEHRHLHQVLGLADFPFRLQFPPADRGLPQFFDLFVQLLPSLLPQHAAQQQPQRAYVAAQRRFLQVAGARLKLGQALRPALGFPQRRHLSLIKSDAP
jgi:hypothetical protein